MKRQIPLVLVLAAALGGCAVGPDFERPGLSPASGYAGLEPASKGAPTAAPGEGPALRWWEAFGSAELNALVDRAIADNRRLAASHATLERARARIEAVAGRRLPQVDANARVEHEQVNLSALGLDLGNLGGRSIGNPELDLYTVGVGVSYDLDLFGRNRRALEQSVAEAEAQRHQTEAAHLIIAGRVVTQVLSIAAIRERIAAARALLAEGQRHVTPTHARRRGGAGTMVEVLSAQGQLAADQGELPQLEQQL